MQTTLKERLRNKIVTEPDDAWGFVVELEGRRGVDSQLVCETYDAYRELYSTSIVVDGTLIPNVARKFKALGFPIETLKHSKYGVIRATVEFSGHTFVLYQKDDALSEVVRQYIDSRLVNVKGVMGSFWRKAMDTFFKR